MSYMNRQSLRSMRKRKRRKRKILAFSIVFLLSIVAYFGISIIHGAIKASNNIYEKIDSSKIPGYETSKINVLKEPFNILLVGLEEQNGGKRSDVLMLVTVNPKTEKIYVLSIPRDTKTYIPALGYETKIAHSFGEAGIESTIESVSQLLDVPIDFYMTANFEGFEDIVDTVGGVTVDVPFTFKAQLTGSLKWQTYYKGEMHLNGNQALAYVRMRTDDPKGDMGRNERQQQVIKEVIDKGISLRTITKIDNIIDSLGDNVRTNIPPGDFVDFVNLYKKLKNTPIETLFLDGNGDWQEKGWFYIVDDESILEISEILNDALVKNNQ